MKRILRAKPKYRNGEFARTVENGTDCVEYNLKVIVWEDRTVELKPSGRHWTGLRIGDCNPPLVEIPLDAESAGALLEYFMEFVPLFFEQIEFDPEIEPDADSARKEKLCESVQP